MVEFVGRYAKDGSIDFIVLFEGFTEDKRYNIVFDISFNKNLFMNEEVLIRVLNNMKKTQPKLEDVTLNHFDEFIELTSLYGMGILVFPSLVMSQNGSYAFSVFDAPPQGINNMFISSDGLVNSKGSHQLTARNDSESR